MCEGVRPQSLRVCWACWRARFGSRSMRVGRACSMEDGLARRVARSELFAARSSPARRATHLARSLPSPKHPTGSESRCRHVSRFGLSGRRRHRCAQQRSRMSSPQRLIPDAPSGGVADLHRIAVEACDKREEPQPLPRPRLPIRHSLLRELPGGRRPGRPEGSCI